jgi:hypothetical protein
MITSLTDGVSKCEFATRSLSVASYRHIPWTSSADKS